MALEFTPMTPRPATPVPRRLSEEQLAGEPMTQFARWMADALASVEVIDAAYDAMWRATWVPISSDLSQSLAAA